MSEEMNTPKELREAYDRIKAERDELLTFKRNTLLEKAGVPTKAHGFVTKALGDDVDWSDADAIRTALTENGLTFGKADTDDTGQSGPPPRTPEDTERIAAQQRTDALWAAGTPPSSTPPSPEDQTADALSRGDAKGAVAAQNAKLLAELG